MAFGNLTVDFRQLSRVPVRDRVALARSPQASEIFGNLTPTEIAALFPDYYKKFIPQGGESMAAGMTGAGFTGTGTGTGTATSTGYTGTTTTPAGPTRPGYVDEIIKAVNPTSAPSSVGAGVSDPRVKKLLGIISSAEGTSSSYDIQYGYQNLKREQAGGKPLTQMTINEVRQLMMNTPKNKRAMGKYQFVPDTFDEVVGQMGLKGDELFDPQMQDRMIIQRLKSKRGLEDYLSGKITKEQFSQNLAYEFASFPSIAHGGRAAYGGVGENTSTPRIGLSTILDELEAIRLMPAEEPATALPGTGAIDPTKPASETGIIPLEQGQTATVLPQVQSFDAIITQYPQLNEWYKTATEEEKSMFKDAVVKLPPEKLKSIMDRHPQKTADLAVTQIGQTVTEKEQSLQVALENKEIVPISHGQSDTFISRSSKGVINAGIDKIDSRLVTLGDAGIRAFEKMNPGYTVRVISGKRTPETNSGSPNSRHLRGGAVDYEIVDPNGNVLSNLGGGKSGSRAKAGFAAPKYEELGRYMEAARRKLAKDDDRYADAKVAAGLYFGGNFWMDSMHMQLGGKTALGDLYTGFKSPEQLAAEGQPRVVVEAVRNAIASGSGNSFNETEMEQLSQFLYETGTAPVDVVTKVNPKVAKKLEEIQVKKNTTQPLPATQPITQEQRPSETDVIPLIKPQEATTTAVQPSAPTANTAPAMKLGGEMDFKEPNTVKESMSLVANGKEVAQFNKNEQVNVEDGRINVENEYQKKARETQQKNDKGTPTAANQFNMRQTVETPRTYPEQVKYGIVPESPSIARQTQMAQFGGYNHFSRRSHSS